MIEEEKNCRGKLCTAPVDEINKEFLVGRSKTEEVKGGEENGSNFCQKIP
jgi:hypothetical protein